MSIKHLKYKLKNKLLCIAKFKRLCFFYISEIFNKQHFSFLRKNKEKSYIYDITALLSFAGLQRKGFSLNKKKINGNVMKTCDKCFWKASRFCGGVMYLHFFFFFFCFKSNCSFKGSEYRCNLLEKDLF